MHVSPPPPNICMQVEVDDGYGVVTCYDMNGEEAFEEDLCAMGMRIYRYIPLRYMRVHADMSPFIYIYCNYNCPVYILSLRRRQMSGGSPA